MLPRVDCGVGWDCSPTRALTEGHSTLVVVDVADTAAVELFVGLYLSTWNDFAIGHVRRNAP